MNKTQKKSSKHDKHEEGEGTVLEGLHDDIDQTKHDIEEGTQLIKIEESQRHDMEGDTQHEQQDVEEGQQHDIEESVQNDLENDTDIVSKTHRLHVIDQPSEVDLDQDKKTVALGNTKTFIVDQVKDKNSDKLQTSIDKDLLTKLSIPGVVKNVESEESIPPDENKEDPKIPEDLLDQASQGSQDVVQADVPESLTHNVESIEPQATQIISETQIQLEDAEVSTHSSTSFFACNPFTRGFVCIC